MEQEEGNEARPLGKSFDIWIRVYQLYLQLTQSPAKRNISTISSTDKTVTDVSLNAAIAQLFDISLDHAPYPMPPKHTCPKIQKIDTKLAELYDLLASDERVMRNTTEQRLIDRFSRHAEAKRSEINEILSKRITLLEQHIGDAKTMCKECEEVNAGFEVIMNEPGLREADNGTKGGRSIGKGVSQLLKKAIKIPTLRNSKEDSKKGSKKTWKTVCAHFPQDIISFPSIRGRV